MSERTATIGDLRQDRQRLHIFCQGCGWEREVKLDEPPFDAIPDSQPIASACVLLKCTRCEERRKIWTAPQIPEASEEARLRWGWTEEEIERARQQRD